MRVLIGCERFGRVREAFRDLGHDAWSCDLAPAVDNSPYHLQCDVLTVLARGWDLAIFHPDCTFLCNSGVKHLYAGGKRQNGEDPARWRAMRKGAKFFRRLLEADIPQIAVENPVMHGHAARLVGRRQDQTVQPWMFGEGETKATCLWLKGLPPLVPHFPRWEDYRKARKLAADARPKPVVHYASPHPERHLFRSVTYQGIATAMARQWGGAGCRNIAA